MRAFFGLNDDHIEAVYEKSFQMKYYGGWSFIEYYNLPIQIREWFYRRLVKQIEEEKKAIEKARER